MQLTIKVSLDDSPGNGASFLLTQAVQPPNMSPQQYLDYWLALVRTEFAKAPVTGA